jgi:hypothetical protein
MHGFEMSAHLWVRKIIKGLLISGIGVLEIVLHQIAVAQGAPDVAVFALEAEDALKVVDGL